MYGFFFFYSFPFFFLAVKGCASVRRQQSKKGGRIGEKKRTGWRDVRGRNPHPSLLLQALIGKYLYFFKTSQAQQKGVGQIKKNT